MRLTLLLACLPLAACGSASYSHDNGDKIAASGSGTSRTYQVADFTKVELLGADDVDVRVGNAFSVRAEGDEKALERLEIVRDGDTLRVGQKRRAGWNWSSGKGAKIFVTMPRLTDAILTGAGDLTVERAEGAVKAELTGAGDLTIGQVSGTSADLDITGSGNIRISGAVDRLKGSIAGSGDIDAVKLTAKSADIDIMGSGNIQAQVNGEADVSIMGSGSVSLGPNAKCRTSKMGSGEVRCG